MANYWKLVIEEEAKPHTCNLGPRCLVVLGHYNVKIRSFIFCFFAKSANYCSFIFFGSRKVKIVCLICIWCYSFLLNTFLSLSGQFILYTQCLGMSASMLWARTSMMNLLVSLLLMVKVKEYVDALQGIGSLVLRLKCWLEEGNIWYCQLELIAFLFLFFIFYLDIYILNWLHNLSNRHEDEILSWNFLNKN